VIVVPTATARTTITTITAAIAIAILVDQLNDKPMEEATNLQRSPTEGSVMKTRFA